MSTSYNSGVVLGVKISDIGFSVEKILNEFEVHDKKGKPTGQFESEKMFKLIFKNYISVVEEIYCDMLDEIISPNSPLEILDINSYYSEYSIDNVIIGIPIVNREYNQYNLIEEIDLEKSETFKAEIKSQFGVDVEPKLFYYFQIS